MTPGDATGAPLTVAEARRRGQGSAHLDADPTYARVFLRRISPVLSWAIVRFTPVSADGVTAASIALGMAGGLLVGFGSVAGDVAALVLLQCAYLLDIADGEVARIRGTAGKRGTYLDLVGHFLQNRALFAGATVSLLAVTDLAPWAIAVGLLVMGFSIPFGYYARLHVVGRPSGSGDHPDHGGRIVARRPTGGSTIAWAAWLYRRLSFLLNQPASMNLFSVALVIDAVRGSTGAGGPLAIPILIATFGPAIAARQIGNAIRLLRAADWAA